ncbi:Abi family protein [Neisseria lisongii]|nr:Abi family protein [Neisseria lisongii]
MKSRVFEQLISSERFLRYQAASAYNNRKAMILYRYNLQLSQELFSMISIFEIILRNKIDQEMSQSDWLRDAVQSGGIFDTPACIKTKEIIEKKYRKIHRNGSYSHGKLIAELNFGLWTNLFQPNQYNAVLNTGKDINRIAVLSSVLPLINCSGGNKREQIHKVLGEINQIRNRIAHHEPICFNRRLGRHTRKNTYYVRKKYQLIINMLKDMSVDTDGLFYGLDHVLKICDKIDAL